MDLTLVNQTDQPDWENYLSLFEAIIEAAKPFIPLSDSYECAVIFVTPSEIKQINQQYRNLDQATDVISFALQEAEQTEYETNILGDIFINIAAVDKQAKDYGHSQAREVGFLFLHGLLHLLGYDHTNLADETKMFHLQDEILKDILPR